MDDFRRRMDGADRFPPEVRRALAYPAPGAWIPRVPPGCIRLSAGYPFPAAVPAAELAATAAALAAEEGDLPLQYLGSPSFARLPSLLAARLRARGIAVGAGAADEGAAHAAGAAAGAAGAGASDGDALLVTAGALQGLDLAARALLAPGDPVAVEAPTYMEALEIFRNYTDSIVTCPVDRDGLSTDALAEDLAGRRTRGVPLPRLLYTIPSFQNPTGATMSLPRRRRLLELAGEYGFLIVEDDAYGELAFGEPPVPLKALDRTGRVIHLGSLSKIVAPGLRIGWAVAPEPIIRALYLYKKDLDHPLLQALAARYLGGIDLQGRITGLRAAYRERRDRMLGALRRAMPSGVTWTEPDGGFFVWLQVPGVDTAALLPEALAAGVAFVPGAYCYTGAPPGAPDPGRERDVDAGEAGAGEAAGRDCLRLSYSYLPPDQVAEGVVRLGRLLAGAPVG